MFRKATAIMLALVASFLGAQAMDLPKPARELSNKNHTKPAAHNRGAKAKAKTVELCLVRTDFAAGGIGTLLSDPIVVTGFQAFIGASVFDCANVKSDGSLVEPAPTQIGVAGITCTGGVPAADKLALCSAELSIDTNWHKTSKTSSIAGSFWADSPKLAINQIMTMINPVVTGTTGAWGKVDNMQTLSLVQIGTSNSYKLTITYKGRGWNPTAY